MNRQPPRRSVLHMLLSVLTRKAPEQTKMHGQPAHYPARHDRDAWHTYWKALGQPWRTEPEIDLKRQEFLTRRRTISPYIEQGIYPFRDVKLDRADIEWLLVTHENGRGPVNWDDENQRGRRGLDLRGADLRNVNLSKLPLACMLGGATSSEDAEKVHLEEANLEYACLANAYLVRAHLQGTYLRWANLDDAYLDEAHLEGADLSFASLEGVNLLRAHLEKACLQGANMRKAYLLGTHLEKSFLSGAHLQGANMGETYLAGAYLGGSVFDNDTGFNGVILSDDKHGSASFVDIRWRDTDLTRSNWSSVKILGDELYAHQRQGRNGIVKSKSEWLDSYQRAVRANRQLAVALQAQGINEDAARFSYRAQALQKRVLWFQMIQQGLKFRQRIQILGAWLFSWFLFLLAGYGYKPWRSFFAYLLVIGTFMALYLLLDPHLLWYEAIVVSMTAFHGRGFSPSTFSPGDPLSVASAIEAFVGLVIEVTFIATLTRRFFGQ